MSVTLNKTKYVTNNANNDLQNHFFIVVYLCPKLLTKRDQHVTKKTHVQFFLLVSKHVVVVLSCHLPGNKTSLIVREVTLTQK